MTPAIASALLPLLRRLDAERAHGIALRALRLGLVGRADEQDDPRLAVSALGLRFANPIGLAAGFDKAGVAIDPLLRLGFGFVEVGTVTPRAQPGNPRPRLFRLSEDHGVINRMGFNNDGIAAMTGRLATREGRGGLVGVNVGINKEGADAERDYPALIAAVARYASYIVINVSSPNTPGLRDLQGPRRLSRILSAVAAGMPARPPLLVKLSPDLGDEVPEIVEACVAGRVDGLVMSNTTLQRPPGLRSAQAGQAGGLSGAPLFPIATAMLARVARLVAGRLAIVGVGGVFTGRDALAKIRAGANLVQVYTSFAEAGPVLIPRLKRELIAAMDEQGFAGIDAAVGADFR